MIWSLSAQPRWEALKQGCGSKAPPLAAIWQLTLPRRLLLMSAGSSPAETVVDWDEVAVHEWLTSLGLAQYQQQIIGGCYTSVCSNKPTTVPQCIDLRLRRSWHIRKYSLCD